MNQSDYQKAADSARACIQSSSPTEPLLSEAANLYSEAVAEVNERLRQAAAVLHQGNADEAVRQCNIEPDLINAVGTLDLAEQDRWQQLLNQNNLSGGEPLLLDVAYELNEAYAKVMDLAELMRTHRLLALGAGPLGRRLGILRRIATVDANNPVWQEDVEVFEKERHKELTREYQEAKSQRDLAAAERLSREIRETQWIRQPSAELAQACTQLVAKLRQKDHYKQLASMAASLEEAYLQKDLDTALELRERWDQQLGECNVPSSDPVYQQAAPALEWVHNEQIYIQQEENINKELAVLERMIDRKAPLDKLDRQVARTARVCDIPDDLQQKIEQYRAAVIARKKTVRRRWIASIITVVAVVLGIILWNLIAASRTEANAREIRRIGSLYESEQYEQVVSAAEGAPDEVANNPDVISWALASKTKLKERDARKQAMQNALAAATAATDAVTARVAQLCDGENQQGITAIVEAKNDVGSLLRKNKDGEQLARDDKEATAAFAALNRRLQSAEADLQREIDTRFETHLQAYQKQLDALIADKTAADIVVGSDALQREVRGLCSQFEPYASGALSEKGRILLRNISSAASRAKKDSQFLSEMEALEENMGDSDQYEAALRRIVSNHPGQPDARDFEAVLREDIPDWRAIEEYSSIADDRKELSADGAIGSDRLGQWLNRAKAFTTMYSGFPQSPLVQSQCEYFEGIGDRAEAKAGFEKLATFLKNPIYADVKFMRFEDGQWCYFSEEPEIRGQQLIVNAIKEPDGTVERKTFRDDYPVFNDKAPHCALIAGTQGVTGRLRALAGKNRTHKQWETYVWKTLTPLIKDPGDAEAEPADPYVRYFIANRILDNALRASPTMKEVMESDHTNLKNADVDPYLDWVWRDEKGNADKARNNARKALDDLGGKIEALQAREVALRAKYQNPNLPSYRPVGYLTNSDGAAWQLEGRLAGADEGELFVAGSPEVPGYLVSIGSVTGGIVKLSPSIPNGKLKFGSPVFLRVE